LIPTTDGSKIIFIYNEILSSTTATTSDLNVTVDESAASISSVATSGSTVELTLTSTVTSGQNVTVSFTDSSSSDDTNATQDSADNDTDSLSKTAVTNNLTACGDEGGDRVSDSPDTCSSTPQGLTVNANGLCPNRLIAMVTLLITLGEDTTS